MIQDRLHGAVLTAGHLA